jgi:hypothetical protein
LSWTWDFINFTYPNIKFDFCPHPANFWWNRKSNNYGGMTGKEKFIKFLKDNNIL